jgi:hypothetical protein
VGLGQKQEGEKKEAASPLGINIPILILTHSAASGSRHLGYAVRLRVVVLVSVLVIRVVMVRYQASKSFPVRTMETV